MSDSPPAKKTDVEPGVQSQDEAETPMDRDAQEAQGQGTAYELEVKEQDRWLPIANGTFNVPFQLFAWFSPVMLCVRRPWIAGCCCARRSSVRIFAAAAAVERSALLGVRHELRTGSNFFPPIVSRSSGCGCSIETDAEKVKAMRCTRRRPPLSLFSFSSPNPRLFPPVICVKRRI